MYKIKDTVIQKFYRTYLSTCDQLTYKTLLAICDERGVVNGCHYKEITSLTGYSEGQYYRSLESLSKKHLIKIENEWGEKTITIIGNDFSGYESQNHYQKFCDLNMKVYDSEAYRNLRASARRILEYFIFRISKQRFQSDEKLKEKAKKEGEKVIDNNLNSLLYTIEKNKSEIHMYSKIKNEVFRNDFITLRMLRSYLRELKDAGFISIGYKIDINNKKYDIITVSAEMLHIPTIEVTEKGKITHKKRNAKHSHFVHFVRHLCRMFKLTYDNLNLINVAELLIQYNKKALSNQKNIYAVMKTALSNYGQYNDTLDSRVIHALTKNIINKDYTNTLLVY